MIPVSASRTFKIAGTTSMAESLFSKVNEEISATLPRILSQGLLFFEKKALLESLRNSVSNRVLRRLAHLVSRFACNTRVIKSL